MLMRVGRIEVCERATLTTQLAEIIRAVLQSTHYGARERLAGQDAEEATIIGLLSVFGRLAGGHTLY
jgi:hypothetical protein